MDHVTAGGAEIPAIGLGTYPMRGQKCRDAVESALELGYRHVDTAQLYDNEAAVGAAVRAADVPRDELFLTTKLHHSNLAAGSVLETTVDSLERLGTYIDLLLVHRPSKSVPIEETIRAMNELQEHHDVAHIGVSNFSIAQLERAIEASSTPIVTNQVSYHAHKDRTELLAYCRDAGVALTAFSPLAKGRLVGDETLARIGMRYDKTASQVALRWLVQQDGVVAIPKAGSRTHQADNLAVFDFELTDSEMREIAEYHGGLTDRLLAAIGFT